MTENLKKAALQEKAELEEAHEQSVSERERPTTQIEIVGKTFEIPTNAPAWIQLFVAKYGVGKDSDVPPEKYLDYIVKILGGDIIDHLIDVGDNNFDGVDFQVEVMAKIHNVWYPPVKKK
jgi:hypothetical protein